MKNRVTIQGNPVDHAPVSTGGRLRLLLESTGLKPLRTDQSSHSQFQYDDEIADSIPWTPVRPHVNGESRNCKISDSSTPARMLFEPILTLQYTSLIIGTILLACLLSIFVSDSVAQLRYSSAIASLDPTIKTFIYFFGATALFYVAFLLRKPVRALEFNKDAGVFWIEKRRIFGWKVGESAQMPIIQVHALQVVSYSSQSQNNSQNYGQNNGNAEDPQSGLHTDQTSAKEYEVNVVFHDGKRVNIINHRNGKAIRHDAEKLAEFLDVPVWNKKPAATEHNSQNP